MLFLSGWHSYIGPSANMNPSPETEIIRLLGLEPHREGGFFKRTYASAEAAKTSREGGTRTLCTSIFYLLTANSPMGHLHRNRSDINHYYHLGGVIRYTLLSPEGALNTLTMGPDLIRGQRLHFTAQHGFWKASELIEGTFALISELVSPGFDYRDMEMATSEGMKRDYPKVFDRVSRLIL